MAGGLRHGGGCRVGRAGRPRPDRHAPATRRHDRLRAADRLDGPAATVGTEAALRQGFNFGSFTTFWLGSTLYLHERFGWSPDQIGTVSILGAVAAFSAPLFAALRNSPAGMAAALILTATTNGTRLEYSNMTAPLHPISSAAGLTLNRRSVLLGMGAAAQSGVGWGMPSSTLVSRTFSTPRQTTHYLESGPADGPLMIFLHGWPELSLVWRAQMDAFAADGWRCVAPDLRGYGGSSAPAANDAYTHEQIVADIAELHDHLGGKPAIWVGHDWGSVVAGVLVAHEPKRSRGVVLISVPYFPDANALPTLVPLVDRTIYPADQYPDGQWDYYRYYTTHFRAAVADLDADKAASLASIFRQGDPATVGKPSPNAAVTRKGGRFGAAHRAPPTRPDPALWPAADFDVLVQAFKAHGFRAPCAWYLNDDANIAYARRVPNGGRLSQPVLFVNGDYDQINSINGNRLGDPMRAACPDLIVTSMPTAHWLPLERKAELIQAMRTWLQRKNL